MKRFQELLDDLNSIEIKKEVNKATTSGYFSYLYQFSTGDELYKVSISCKEYPIHRFLSDAWDWSDKSEQVELDIVKYAGKLKIDLGKKINVVDFMFVDSEGEISINNSGNAPLVFSTVFKCIRDFVTEYSFDVLMFSANEPSRRKLYDTMVRVLSKKYNFYNFAVETDGEKEYFVVNKTQTELISLVDTLL
jgi:hypothetical protein